ncbi:MAG: hypothetical protein NTX82_01860 [Candidatus Parcubacteria bacterium]|nr:hypothetical protein [Candidatus Parcubacteria bacterium]
MFNQNQKGAGTQAQEKAKTDPYEMHVMPAKFHQYLSPRKKSKLGKFLFVFLVIFLVLAGMAFGAYYLYTSLRQVALPNSNQNNQPAVPTVNLNQNQSEENLNQPNENLNANTNANDNLNVNDNLNANENSNVNINLNENLNVNENQNTNENLNLNINVPILINYITSADADLDRLTDTEEDLYTTEKRKPDTDGDGYLDGDELVGGYNPKEGGGAALATSGLVNKYSNPLFNYEILYPKDFLAKPTDSSLNEVIFQSSTEEYFAVSVEDNPEQTDLVNWYLAQSPGADLNSLEKITTKKGYTALISPDKLTYYLQVSDKLNQVFMISYNIGTLKEVNFLTTLQMMVNSFSLVLTANLNLNANAQ